MHHFCAKSIQLERASTEAVGGMNFLARFDQAINFTKATTSVQMPARIASKCGAFDACGLCIPSQE